MHFKGCFMPKTRLQQSLDNVAGGDGSVLLPKNPLTPPLLSAIGLDF